MSKRDDQGHRVFEAYVHELDTNSVLRSEGGPFRCACCGYLTLAERGGYEICPVCRWEDDGQDDGHIHTIPWGPNNVTLAQARENYRTFGASEEDRRSRARPPLPEER